MTNRQENAPNRNDKSETVWEVWVDSPIGLKRLFASPDYDRAAEILECARKAGGSRAELKEASW